MSRDWFVIALATLAVLVVVSFLILMIALIAQTGASCTAVRTVVVCQVDE